jgi:hypothetical protein
VSLAIGWGSPIVSQIQLGMKSKMFECRSNAARHGQFLRWIAVLCVLALSGTAHGSDLWAANWQKAPSNPVLSLTPGSFDSQNIFAPAIAKHDSTYYLYYSGGPSGPLTGEDFINHQLGLATSTDGVHFTKLGEPLLPLGVRDNFHATPTLLRNPQGDLQLDESGTWHLFFNGNRADDVEHATSADGIHWTKDPLGPIYQNAYAPNILKVGDEYRMYYVHKPASGNWQIHMATGPSIYSLQPSPANPILTQSQAWESSNLFYPYVLQDNGVWTMFYAGYWTPGKTAMGTATSTDGVYWTKTPANPIFTPTPGSTYDSLYTSSQAVIRDGDVYRMFYAGRIDTIHKYYSINMATMPVSGLPATSLRWTQAGLGAWDATANWAAVDGGSIVVPNSDETTAILGGAITDRSTIVLQSAVTLKSLQFDSQNSYALAGSGSIHCAASTGQALIENTQGAHQIQVPVTLEADTLLQSSTGTLLEFNNRINLNGHDLLVSGAGTVALNNMVTTDGGQVVVTGGGTASGAGSLMGNLFNGGTVSPGNSSGRLTISGTYRQSQDALLQLELSGAHGGAEYDILHADAAFLDGSLKVRLLNAFEPRAGDVFHVLEFHSVHGRFEQVDLPILAGLSWDMSSLYVAGTLLVVPEPPVALHLLFAAIALSMKYASQWKRPRRGLKHV